MDISIFFQRPHLIEDFLFCKRQFYLHAIRFYVFKHSLLDIGKAYHENKPVEEYPVKVDGIDWSTKQILEFKKRDFGIPALVQSYFYLKLMNEKFNKNFKKAKISSIEKRKSMIILYPDKEYEKILADIFFEVKNMKKIPILDKKKSFCKNCSFFDYCWGGEV